MKSTCANCGKQEIGNVKDWIVLIHDGEMNNFCCEPCVCQYLSPAATRESNQPSTPDNNRVPWYKMLRRGVMLPFVYLSAIFFCLGTFLLRTALCLSYGSKIGDFYFKTAIGYFGESK